MTEKNIKAIKMIRASLSEEKDRGKDIPKRV